jgi:hypothetical protein
MSDDAPTRALDDQQLGELLTLLKDVDTVELKLTVPDSIRRSAVAALEMDALDAQIRQVFFFDTPDLVLDRAGVVARARRSQGRADDTVIKLRPAVPGDLPADLRSRKDFGVEVDIMPGGFVCSASFKGALDRPDVKEVAAGRRPVSKLFSKHQRAFFAEHAPDGVELDDLSILGPINVFKLKFSPTELGRKMVAELWLYPDGGRILELSTKSAPADTFRVAAEVRSYLSSHGVSVGGEQQTKTRTALDIFSAELRAAAEPAEPPPLT